MSGPLVMPGPAPAAVPLAVRRRRTAWFWLRQFFALAFITAAIGLRIVYQPVVVYQDSMAPTLADGDRLLVDRRPAQRAELARGQIVVLRKPGSEELVIKRIVGLPGETLTFIPPGVLLGRQFLIEPYVFRFPYLPQRLTAAEDEYIVLGDNRGGSEDSRDYGPVPKDRILGPVVLRFWPKDRFTSFERPREIELPAPTEPGAQP
ncbi:MAG TPA: signal peptidase I [Armatimonadetes bacterium]|nr:signal peptidase I [Armatimonadota bacterium]